MSNELFREDSIENLTPREQAGVIFKTGILLAHQNNLILVATTSGGRYSATLMGLLLENNIKIPVIFVDMGPACYTNDTYKMIETFRSMGVDVHRYFSQLTNSKRPPNLTELNEIYGPNWRDPATPEYQEVMKELKEIPCQHALGCGGIVLFRGTRTNLNIPERANINFFDRHKQGMVVHPIAKWSDGDTVGYLNETGLPINNRHTDPSRARMGEEGIKIITYPDGTTFLAEHTVCRLDLGSEKGV